MASARNNNNNNNNNNKQSCDKIAVRLSTGGRNKAIKCNTTVYWVSCDIFPAWLFDCRLQRDFHAYGGLQCDGIHFGKGAGGLHGCAGFSSVVTDVVVQAMLNKVCSGV